MFLTMKVKYNRRSKQFTGVAEYSSNTVEAETVSTAAEDFWDCARQLVDEAEAEFGGDVYLHTSEE